MVHDVFEFDYSTLIFAAGLFTVLPHSICLSLPLACCKEVPFSRELKILLMVGIYKCFSIFISSSTAIAEINNFP
jgi:hypothetical protein